MISLIVSTTKCGGSIEYSITVLVDILVALAVTIIGSLILSGIIPMNATETLVIGIPMVSVQWICLVFAIFLLNRACLIDSGSWYKSKEE